MNPYSDLSETTQLIATFGNFPMLYMTCTEFGFAGGGVYDLLWLPEA